VSGAVAYRRSVVRGAAVRGGVAGALRGGVAAALAGSVLLGAPAARAHLIPAQQGTVNVVGAAVFAVLSVPVSALHDADDNHDGTIDLGEFERHEATLRAEIDRRLVILDGATPARTVRVDLILSPQHDAAGGGDQVVALKHAELDAPPGDLRVRCDLFGAGAAQDALTITATRHPEAGVETAVAVLTPGAPERGFFSPVAAAPQRAVLGAMRRVPRGWLGLSGVFGAALVLAGWSRGRRAARATP
jgi:hypothetical protein